MRIGIVAPSCPLAPDIPDQLRDVAAQQFGAVAPELIFHAQCFVRDGHFAGSDAVRTDAFVEMANDPSIDAIWFARGGYGACRIAQPAIAQLTGAARAKAYLGYSDAGFLLGGLYARGFARVAHGPMPADLTRTGGKAAVVRALDWLMTGAPPAPCKQLAFNLTVLSQMIGTPVMPDMSGHILMIEDVSEYLYRIDRSLFHITSTAAVRAVAGIKLGRFSQIPENDVDFGMSEVDIVSHWCAVSGIAYLGRADIGHDGNNQVVAFG